MISQAKVSPGAKAALAGDISSLLEQLGSPEQDFWSAKTFPALRTIDSQPRLRRFLETYQAELLFPLELPAVFQAYRFTCGNQCRELIALDQRLSAEPRLKQFAAASQHVGQLHLARLRPLRDHRLVQRYFHAIESKEAFGWHTLVYGVTLAVFSLPLRQSLTAFANQTLHGFTAGVSRAHGWEESSCGPIIEEFSRVNAMAVEKLFVPALHVQ